MSKRGSVVAIALLLTACGDNSLDGPSGGGGSGGEGEAAGGSTANISGGMGGTGGQTDLPNWEPCALDTGATDDDAECATIQVPVRYDVSAGMIPLFIKRVRPLRPARAHLWLLQGGPGAAGNGWEPFVRQMQPLLPDVEFYLPDHRGTGRSAKLECPNAEATGSPGGSAITDEEWPACAQHLSSQWGDNLAGFSSENAARDIELAIGMTRAEDTRVVLYGASYGTTWGHRFLQLFPSGAVDAVVLDSTNWPDRTYEDYDQLWEGAAHRLFDACTMDAQCGGALGPDPWQALRDLYSSLDAGHCSALADVGITSEVLRYAVAWSVAYAELRGSGLALVRRAIRCNPEDEDAIVHYVDALFGPGGLLTFEDPLFSEVLSHHILESEVHRADLSSTAKAFAETCTVCIGAGAIPFDPDWPRYAFDGELTMWTTSSTPVLIMNGGMDPFAPSHRLFEAGVEAAFDGPNQYVVDFPAAAHGTVTSSKVTGIDEPPCGLQLFMHLLENPAEPLDLACTASLAPPDFSVPAPTASFLFGTPDAWGE
ncbi:MAG: alpha/beta fold hydrolase [Polyangiaceae bacterium]|nr:alpha/beta fold hydrolase [Polyangiaceae bacterium]